MNYYNENDKKTAQWLRNLIDAKLIPAGHVDDRSIVDVQPADLDGFIQCHFFAGIGGWSYALRLAGWSDDRPVWTGSCPCQSFSNAGSRLGFADARDLWPEMRRLIEVGKPDVFFGEQVDDAPEWYDRTADDLEVLGYACGSCVVPACAVGSPHERSRLWFVADRDNTRWHCGDRQVSDGPWAKQQLKGLLQAEARLAIRSGTYRLLDDGIPNRLGLFCGFGNAIVPQVAAEFIRAFMETEAARVLAKEGA